MTHKNSLIQLLQDVCWRSLISDSQASLPEDEVDTAGRGTQIWTFGIVIDY